MRRANIPLLASLHSYLNPVFLCNTCNLVPWGFESLPRLSWTKPNCGEPWYGSHFWNFLYDPRRKWTMYTEQITAGSTWYLGYCLSQLVRRSIFKSTWEMLVPPQHALSSCWNSWKRFQKFAVKTPLLLSFLCVLCAQLGISFILIANMRVSKGAARTLLPLISGVAPC